MLYIDLPPQQNYINLKTSKDTILLLGDSFAEGYGVEIENSFAKIIEKNSDKQVLNFGSAGSFGPLQEYLIYENLAYKYGFDEIILFFLPENDFTDNSSAYQDALFENRYRPYFDVDSKNFEIYYPANSKPSDNFNVTLLYVFKLSTKAFINLDKPSLKI